MCLFSFMKLKEDSMNTNEYFNTNEELVEKEMKTFLNVENDVNTGK